MPRRPAHIQLLVVCHRVQMSGRDAADVWWYCSTRLRIGWQTYCGTITYASEGMRTAISSTMFRFSETDTLSGHTWYMLVDADFSPSFGHFWCFFCLFWPLSGLCWPILRIDLLFTLIGWCLGRRKVSGEVEPRPLTTSALSSGVAGIHKAEVVSLDEMLYTSGRSQSICAKYMS